MANYAYVENNEIVDYQDTLPRNWRNISGLYLLANDVATLLQLGWYPIVKVPVEYNPKLSYVSDTIYEIMEDCVIERQIIIDYTQDELDFLWSRNKNNFLEQLRSDRNRKLTDTDWTQVTDLQNIKPQEWVTAWQNYRQELRELPEQYTDLPDYENVVIQWPRIPYPNEVGMSLEIYPGPDPIVRDNV
jgi:hypothetical protein